MKKLAKKLSAMTVCAVFASIQIASASPIDTGLGNGLGGAVINNATGGLKDVTTGVGNASLNFNGSAHVNWDSLNLNKGETLMDFEKFFNTKIYSFQKFVSLFLTHRKKELN